MGKGAFIKTETGWMIDTKVKVNGEWKHFKKTGYPTLAAAKADFETAKAIFIQNNSKHHEVLLFDDLYEEYEEFRKLKVKVSSLDGEKYQNKKHILSYFSGKLIKDVFNTTIITNWYKTILNIKDVSDNKKNRIYTAMKRILLFAYNKRYIDAEAYQNCDTIVFKIAEHDEHKKKIIWTNEEEQRFFEATKENEIDDLMFHTFFLCATRISEFLGLQVKCFIPDKRCIIIQQQLQYVEGKKVLTKELKSEQSYRTIVISQELNDRLINYINAFGLKPDDFLFHNKTSPKSSLSKTTFRRKLYHYCEKANVEKIVPHGVRHAMAVKLAKGCETTQDIEVCASRLGHTPSVFMDIYANHTKVEEQEKLMNKILNI